MGFLLHWRMSWLSALWRHKGQKGAVTGAAFALAAVFALGAAVGVAASAAIWRQGTAAFWFCYLGSTPENLEHAENSPISNRTGASRSSVLFCTNNFLVILRFQLRLGTWVWFQVSAMVAFRWCLAVARSRIRVSREENFPNELFRSHGHFDGPRRTVTWRKPELWRLCSFEDQSLAKWISCSCTICYQPIIKTLC